MPEHEPAYIRKVVLHALASSIPTDSPLLAVMIFPTWDDSPWTTHSILSYPNITTLVHLSPNQLKLILANKQLDNELYTTLLQATDHPTNILIIANKE